jgi:hypothetical protein
MLWPVSVVSEESGSLIAAPSYISMTSRMQGKLNRLSILPAMQAFEATQKLVLGTLKTLGFVSGVRTSVRKAACPSGVRTMSAPNRRHAGYVLTARDDCVFLAASEAPAIQMDDPSK